MSDSTIFSNRARTIVIVLLSLSALGTIVGLLYGSDLVSEPEGDRDSYDHGPLGHRALYETLTEMGWGVQRDRRGEYANANGVIAFLEPDEPMARVASGGDLELAELVDARFEQGATGSIVVVLPKWQPQGGNAAAEVQPDRATERVLEVLAPEAQLNPVRLGSHSYSTWGALGRYELSVPHLQTVSNPPGEILLAVDGGTIAFRTEDDVVVLTDPDLLHNWNIQRADHASAVVAVLNAAGAFDSVRIDEVFHGYGVDRSIASAMGKFPAVLITVQGLLLLLLVLARGLRRFGPPLRVEAAGQGPAESIAVSAFVLSEGRRAGSLLKSYVSETMTDLSLGFDGPSEPEAAAEHVDAVARRRRVPEGAKALLAAAQERAQRRNLKEHEALAIAQKAHDFRRRLLGDEPEPAPPAEAKVDEHESSATPR